MIAANSTGKQATGKWPNTKWIIAAAVAAGLLLLAGANAHLLYVALTSQPDCVAHVKPGETAGSGMFSAAKSSCSGARR
jgi:hypothetical protein